MAFNKQTASIAGKKSKRKKDVQLNELRIRFSNLLEDNQDNIQKWLDEVAKDDPGKALDLILKIGSFVLPKPRSITFNDSDPNDKVMILNIDPLED